MQVFLHTVVMSKATLAFVDDHPILLQGLERIFASDQSFLVVARGKTAADAIDISRSCSPDVIVIDLNMPGNAFEAIRAITGQSINTKVVAFTAATEIDLAVRALECGASGYVLKGNTIEELRAAICAVLQGETFVSQDVAFKVVSAFRKAAQQRDTKVIQLSAREEQVVKLLLQGMTNREIAAELGIGEKTVKHYMTILMQKLHVRNRLEVVIAAQKLSTGTDGRERGSPLN